MTTYTTEAICLKTYDYGESSRITHFYSPQWGLVRAIAKGVRGNKSKLSGACELLHRSEIHLVRGRNLDVLCQYQSLSSFWRIRGDILKLSLATLYAELVNLLATEHDMDSEEIYGGLKTALERLEQEDEPGVLSLSVDFQLFLLSAAGYGPVFNHCVVSGETIAFDRPYYPFSPDLGGVVARPEGSMRTERLSLVNVSVSTLKVLHEPFAGYWDQADPVKVFKFLQYFFSHKLERKIQAYDFALQLLGSPALL